MTPAVRAGTSNDRTYLWIACLLALCAGYYIAFYRFGAAIDEQHDLASGVSATVRANTYTLAGGPALEQTERTLDAQLSDLQLRADRATTVARFIRESARIAAAHGSTLSQIDERRADSVNQRFQSVSADGPFDVIPLDITLIGSYRSLILTIHDLTQASIPMGIEIATIERDGSGAELRSAPLTARVRVRIERISDETSTRSAAIITSQEAIHARPF